MSNLDVYPSLFIKKMLDVIQEYLEHKKIHHILEEDPEDRIRLKGEISDLENFLVEGQTSIMLKIKKMELKYFEKTNIGYFG